MEPREYSEEIDLRKYWLVLKRRWLASTLVFSGTVAFAAVITSLQNPIYQASGKLLFRTDRAPLLTGLDSAVTTQPTMPLAKNSDLLGTQSEIIRSLPIAEATVEALELKNAKGDLINPQLIANSLTVKPVAGTDVLEISYESNDPKLAAAVVNQVMQAYIENDVKTNRADAQAAGTFIQNQLPKSEQAVSEAEAALRQFKEQNGVVVLEEEASAAVSTMSTLDREITEARAQLAETTARASALRRQVGTDAATSVDISSLNQSPGVQEALTKLQEVQAELASTRAAYRSGHPAVTRLEREEAQLQAVLGDRVRQVLGRNQQVPIGELQIGTLRQDLISDYVQAEVERLSLVRRINDLSGSQSAYEQRAQVLPALEKTQRELERRLDAAQTTYQTLLTQLQEVQVAANQNVGNARVISIASVPRRPVAPRKAINLAAGGVAGILLGIVAAFLLDLTDRSVKTLKEVRESFGQTLLGVIPNFGRSGKTLSLMEDPDQGMPRVVVREAPTSPVREAYQMLHANLKFLTSDSDLKAIVITSSVPKEGKSEVAANLAAEMAQVRRRVLLVDADMRHPTQHHAWGLTNLVGLSNVVVGQVKFSEAVQAIMPNLHVLTAGVVPPNPLFLLDSSRMASLVEAFSRNYDFVIFDTPALAGTADAAVIGKLTDGTLMVVRPGLVDSASGNAAKAFLAQSGQNVLGVVVNGVNVKNEPDSYFYYTREEQAIAKPDVVAVR
jgi:polysaccharide biosynthesis transport protein